MSSGLLLSLLLTWLSSLEGYLQLLQVYRARSQKPPYQFRKRTPIFPHFLCAQYLRCSPVGKPESHVTARQRFVACNRREPFPKEEVGAKTFFGEKKQVREEK